MNKLFFYITIISCNIALANNSQKIYDCFTFFNELEILDIRLNELYDHVDKFVLVEAKETHRGDPKPLYYQENKDKFSKFSNKIIHVIINTPLNINVLDVANGLYSFTTDEFTSSNWARENDQRNQIMHGLIDCNPDDLIFISDVDEIIDSSVINIIKNKLNEPHDELRFVTCEQKLYKYFLNRLDSTDWKGSVATLFKDLKKSSPQWFRFARDRGPYIMKNGGWHFSYMGGYQKVINKLASFAHSECDTPEQKSFESIKNKISQCTLVEIDDTYPNYIYNNLEKFKNIKFIDYSEKK